MTDAHNAASELAASDGALLFRVLCLAWWLSPPDHLLQSARATAFIAKDAHALFSALVGAECSLPPIKPQPQAITTSKSLCEIQKAIKKRRASEVYKAALAMTKDELKAFIPEPFLQAMIATVYKPLEYRILEHACHALTAYPSVAPNAKQWNKYPAGISGRVFTISEEACAAWNVRLPSADEIKGDPHKLIQIPMFETEEMEDAFWEKHFPDDIPDEWSDEEIEKSHGRIISTTSRNPWRTAFFDCF